MKTAKVTPNSPPDRKPRAFGQKSRPDNAAHTRPAGPDDLAALVSIYNHYVRHTPITFETETFSAPERQSWLDGFSAAGRYRLLVVESDGVVHGYASSSQFNPRPAYSSSVETSIYLHPDAIGYGLGRLLYASLLDELDRDPRLHRAYGGITLPNRASIALHESLGFRLAGTFTEVGYKFDRYWDVARYERNLQFDEDRA